MVDTDEFVQDFVKIAAKQMRKVPKGLWENAMAQIMDATSLYAPYTYRLLKIELGAEPSKTVARMEKRLRQR